MPHFSTAGLLEAITWASFALALAVVLKHSNNLGFSHWDGGVGDWTARGVPPPMGWGRALVTAGAATLALFAVANAVSNLWRSRRD